MNFHGGLRSWSGRTLAFVALALACYLALNAVLIRELVEQVQAGRRTPAAQTLMQTGERESFDTAACAETGKVDRDMCRAASVVTTASNTLREHWRERRAAHEGRRAVSPGR